MRPTLALLHTTHLTVPTLKALAAERLPEVRNINILDDSLLADVIAAGSVTPAVEDRLRAYIYQAAVAGASAVLCCCSSVGEAAERLRATAPIPVLRIDEPMAGAAVRAGRLVGVIATVKTTLEPTAKLVRRTAAEAGREVQVEAVVVEGAFAALGAGRPEEHDRLVLDALRSLIERSDVVVLAQASMARLIGSLGSAPAVPVLSSPESGIDAAGAAVMEAARG